MSNKDKSKVDSIKDANQPKTLEEALALIAKMQATIDAQKQKENESAQGTVETVQSLRAALNQKDEELKQKDHELDIALTDNKKLIANQKNIKTLIKNLKTDLKELPKYAEALILKDENLNNIHDIQSLYDFTYELVLTLISNVKEKIRHREKALNLGTTEANSAKSIANKEDDIKAHEDGEEEFKKLVEASDIQEDEDKKEIEESSREFTSAPKKDNSKAPSTSVLDDIKNKDLKDGNDALAVLTPILEDTAKARYNNEGVVRPKAKTTYTQSHDDKIVAVTSIDTKTKYECYCPYCKKVQPFKIEAKLDRVNKVLHANSVGEITSILKSVHNATCTCCGETIQINPAAQMDFNVHKPLVPVHSKENSLKQDRNDLDTKKTASTSHLSDNQSNDRNDTETSLGQQRYINKLVQKERKDNYQKIKNSPSSGITTFDVENIMVTLKNGVKIINPWLLDNELFSFSNAFSKSSLSVGLITALGIQFAQLGVPKNRTADYFQDHGMKMSTQNLIGTTNAFARAYLHPVCKVILKHIIQNNVCVAMDESTLLVRETAKKKMAQGKGRKSQIWNISTPWTAKDQAAWFTVSSGRGHENVVDILKNASPDLKFLLTDGYSGYSAATKAIRELFGLDVDNCRCHTHARRPVHYELKARGLLKVYNTYLVPNGNFTSFAKNLKDYIEKTKNPKDKKLRKLTEKDVDLLTIYYFINSLFYIDSSVVAKYRNALDSEEFKAELLKVRQEKSKTVVDTIFDLIRLYITKYPRVIDVTCHADGSKTYKPNQLSTEAPALIYLLRYEEDLKRFIQSPEIELCQSVCERALKLGICARKSFMFIDSVDGSHAFANYQTIINTCNLNRVPVHQYIIWLVANIKYRLIKRYKEGHGDPTFLRLPSKQKDSEGKLLPIYHPKNTTCYDNVDVTGLTPYDYRKYLEQFRPE